MKDYLALYTVTYQISRSTIIVFTYELCLECNFICISSVVPAVPLICVCNTMPFNFVNMAESKVENVRENIKMNLKSIINKCFTNWL